MEFVELFRQPIAAVAFSALVFNIFVCRETLLNRTFRTPLALTGRAIDTLERRYNRPELTREMRRSDGISAMIALIIGAVVVGFALGWAFEFIPFGWLPEALIAGLTLSLRTHIDQLRVLAGALRRSTAEASATLALISGVDTSEMDNADIAHLGVGLTGKVIAEGFLGPLMYFLVLGLPGLLVFKMINTASTMIDEKTDYGADFGWAASRLNEWLIWPVDRIAAGVTIFAAFLTPGVNGTAAAKAAAGGHRLIRPKRLGWILATTYGAMGLQGPGDNDGPIVAAQPEHIDASRPLLLTIAIICAVLLAVAIILGLPLPADIL